mmetsp:Transcript_8770/g.26443  ORF Transcript_8770/g.26443 Transcript_8770/m.26443 type:complete len:220 (+) Transcript_8770:2614-3273(+)
MDRFPELRPVGRRGPLPGRIPGVQRLEDGDWNDAHWVLVRRLEVVPNFPLRLRRRAQDMHLPALQEEGPELSVSGGKKRRSECVSHLLQYECSTSIFTEFGTNSSQRRCDSELPRVLIIAHDHVPLGLPELPQGPRFNLADPLPRHVKLPAYLLQGHLLRGQDTVPQRDDLPLPLAQRVQQVAHVYPEPLLVRKGLGGVLLLVRDHLLQAEASRAVPSL